MSSEFNGWVLDENASTEERTVLYYTGILKTGEVSPSFADTLSIDREVAKKVTTTETVNGNYKTITMTYDYDGVELCWRLTWTRYRPTTQRMPLRAPGAWM